MASRGRKAKQGAKAQIPARKAHQQVLEGTTGLKQTTNAIIK